MILVQGASTTIKCYTGTVVTSKTQKIDAKDHKGRPLFDKKAKETTCPEGVTQCIKSGGTVAGGNLKYFLGKLL